MEIRGQIEDIIFNNESNSYTVCTMILEKEIITAVGYLPFINIGDIIIAEGNFVKHNTYGEQFKIDKFEKTMPNTIKEIEKYLGSGIIKGVGPAAERALLQTFGSVERIKSAELKQIAACLGAKRAAIVYKHFHPEE